MIRKILPLVSLILLSTNVFAKELKVTRITPNGDDVEPMSQIVITFNQDVVPIGEMSRKKEEIPVKITPNLDCKWRWIDNSNLACMLEDGDMKAATKYSVEVGAVKTLNGEELQKTYEHSFITRRPLVSYSYFHQWQGANMPIFVVNFDQPVQIDSLEDAFYFQDSASSKKYDAKVEVRKEESSRVFYVYPAVELAAYRTYSLYTTGEFSSKLGDEKRKNEKKELQKFATFPATPKFLGFSCSDGDNKDVKDYNVEDCDPSNYSTMVFNVPVKANALKYAKVTPSISIDEEENQNQKYSNDSYTPMIWDNSHSVGKKYYVYLPRFLKSGVEYKISFDSKLKDVFGRGFEDGVGTISFGPRSPYVNVKYSMSVLEKQEQTEIPVFITNISNLDFDCVSVTADGVKKKSETKKYDYPKNIAVGTSLGVRKLLSDKSGIVACKLTSNDLKKDKKEVFVSIVTPWNLSIKVGHYNSSVWVTDMKTGLPVEGAKVSFYKSTTKNIGDREDLDSKKTDKNGLAILGGVKEMDPKLEFINSWDNEKDKLFVRVEKGGELAIMPFTYDFKVWIDGIPTYLERENSHIKVWGITPQVVYKKGQVVDFKLFVRDDLNETLGLARKKKRFLFIPYYKTPSLTVTVVDPLGKEVYKNSGVKLSKLGTFVDDFKLSKTAVSGTYMMKASIDDAKYSSLYPLEFVVSDFNASNFKVETLLSAKSYKSGDTLKVSTEASLLSGAPYTAKEARINVEVQPSHFDVSNPLLYKYNFPYPSYDEKNVTVLSEDFALSTKGKAEALVKLKDYDIPYAKIIVESSVKDDNGKAIASSSVADFFGVDRFIGIRNTDFDYRAGKEFQIEYAVVDTKGEIVSAASVNGTLEISEVSFSKIKGSGNVYEEKREQKWSKVASCKGTSSISEQLCKLKVNKSGEYRITFEGKDTKGKKVKNSSEFYVTGKDYVLWAKDKGDVSFVDLVPNKSSYKIGDVAKFMVKNPYPGAYAYVSIERNGIIETTVKKLNNSMEFIEVPIKDNYMPGFYLSVTIFSPRVDKAPQESADGKVILDLGKPSVKMGYIRVPVIDSNKKIVMEVSSDKAKYKPRQKAKVTVKLSEKDRKADLTAIVIDEGVLELQRGKLNNYDIYSAFYKLGDLDLVNYNTLLNLVGRQKVETKGQSQGGDGGGGIEMRNDFKFIAYYNNNLKANGRGEATFEVNLPDNLTRWKVIVIAAGTDRFGHNVANIDVDNEIEVRKVAPNQIGEGDKSSIGLSVTNRTDKKQKVKVEINVTGDITKPVQISKDIELNPMEKKSVLADVLASNLPIDASKGNGIIKVEAKAYSAEFKDGMVYSVPVLKLRSFDVATEYSSLPSDQKELKIPIKIPSGIYDDVGGMSVTFSPTLMSGLEESFIYMRDYPYPCWEQRLSVAVMAMNYKNMKKYVPSVEWKGADSNVIKNVLNTASDYQAPNGGMTYFIAEDSYVSPYLSAYTALAFTWLKDNGYKVPKDVEEKLHNYLKKYMKTSEKDLVKNATIRSIILYSLIKANNATDLDLNRLQPALKDMTLLGKAYFLSSATELKNEDLKKQALDAIMANANTTSGKYMFSDAYDYKNNTFLITPMRDNCVILSALTKLNDESIKEVPMKLVRTIIQQRKSGRWVNTQENVFCLNALSDYATKYESEKTKLNVKAVLGNTEFGSAKFDSVKDKPVIISKNFVSSDIGKSQDLKFERDGSGIVYTEAKMKYSYKKPLETINSGISVEREYLIKKNGVWVKLTKGAKLKRGDLVKVNIMVSAPAARSFVVVNDPVPGGLEPLNMELGNVSSVDAGYNSSKNPSDSIYYKKNNPIDFGSFYSGFYFKELNHDVVRFYSDYLNAGNYYLSYVAQVVASGKFNAYPVFAHEMYDEDIYGKGTLDTFEILED